LTPTLMYLIQAGVNLKTAVYFLSNPLIKKYASEQRKIASSVASLNGIDAEFYKKEARIKMLTEIGLPGLIKVAKDGSSRYIDKKGLQSYTLKVTKNLNLDARAEALSENSLENELSEDAIAAFLHFLELEKVAEGITSIKTTLNYDTNKMSSFYEAEEVNNKILNLHEQGIFPSKVIDDIVGDSVIGLFKIDDFMLELWSPLFKIRNDKAMNKFIFDILNDIKKVKYIKKAFGTTEAYVEQFKNDIIVKQFTDVIGKEGSDNMYRGIPMVKNPNEKSKKGVSFKTVNKKLEISINDDTISKQFESLMNKDSLSSDGNAHLKSEMFHTKGEYLQFVIEREYQRFLNPLTKMKSETYFKYKMDRNSKYFAEGLPFEVVEELTYEEILRDTALTNNLNLYQLFQSEGSTMDLFNEISNLHPELLKNYDVIRDLINSISKDKKYKNLQLKDNRLTGLEADVYYDNLVELSDLNQIEIDTEDPIEKKRVADFFKHFSLSGFLQSGMDFKGNLTLGTILPQENILKILEDSDPISNIDFESFNRTLYNNRIDVSKRSRVKDYRFHNFNFSIFDETDLGTSTDEDLLSPDDKPCNGGLPI